MNIEIIKMQSVRIPRFLDFWNRQYRYRNMDLYDSNIGEQLTSERVQKLFAWKNGSKAFEKIAEKKRDSITRNFIQGDRTVPSDDEQLLKFLVKPGGAIHRIFWLHCLSHGSYPIFDQHVYRAMRYIQSGVCEELPYQNREKVNIYVEQYLPFWKRLKKDNDRKADRALWAFGKFIKRGFKIDGI